MRDLCFTCVCCCHGRHGTSLVTPLYVYLAPPIAYRSSPFPPATCSGTVGAAREAACKVSHCSNRWWKPQQAVVHGCFGRACAAGLGRPLSQRPQPRISHILPSRGSLPSRSPWTATTRARRWTTAPRPLLPRPWSRCEGSLPPYPALADSPGRSIVCHSLAPAHTPAAPTHTVQLHCLCQLQRCPPRHALAPLSSKALLSVLSESPSALSDMSEGVVLNVNFPAGAGAGRWWYGPQGAHTLARRRMV